MSSTTRVHRRDADHILAIHGNVLIEVCRTAVTVADVRGLRRSVVDLVATTTGSLSVLVVIDAAARPPESAARAELATVSPALGARGRGIALVVEGSGFQAAAQRAVITAVAGLTKSPLPFRVFRNVLEAEAWLHTRMQGTMGVPGELARAVATLRGRPGIAVHVAA